MKNLFTAVEAATLFSGSLGLDAVLESKTTSVMTDILISIYGDNEISNDPETIEGKSNAILALETFFKTDFYRELLNSYLEKDGVTDSSFRNSEIANSFARGFAQEYNQREGDQYSPEEIEDMVSSISIELSDKYTNVMQKVTLAFILKLREKFVK